MSRLLMILFAIAACGGAHAEERSDAIFLVGALHGLHDTEPSFSFDHLRQILEAAQPDVLVLEVRPDELAGRTDTPGRPEYPAVVWPFLAERSAVAVAMEPGGETFAKMTGAAAAAFGALARDKPAADAFLTRLRRSQALALQAHWRSPADAHDQVTADLVQAEALALAHLGGPGPTDAQAAWDGYMVEQARAAAAAHPGKRVLVLASYRNLPAFRRGFAGEPRLADTEGWLRRIQAPAR